MYVPSHLGLRGIIVVMWGTESMSNLFPGTAEEGRGRRDCMGSFLKSSISLFLPPKEQGLAPANQSNDPTPPAQESTSSYEISHVTAFLGNTKKANTSSPVKRKNDSSID